MSIRIVNIYLLEILRLRTIFVPKDDLGRMRELVQIPLNKMKLNLSPKKNSREVNTPTRNIYEHYNIKVITFMFITWESSVIASLIR